MKSYDPEKLCRAEMPHMTDRQRSLPVQVLGPPLTLWIVSKELTEVTVHWDGKRTFGCILVHGEGPCPCSKFKWATRKQWWLTVADRPCADAGTNVVCLTRVAVQSAPMLVYDAGSLWGRTLTLWRHPDTPTGVMYAQCDYAAAPKDLPSAEPTIHTLIRMWQARTRHETLVRKGLKEGRSPSPGDEPNS